MSSRPLLKPHTVIDNGDLSQASITSDPTVVQMLSLVSYSVSWVGSSPSGTFEVQVSNDYSLNADGTVKNSGTWTALTLSETPTISGSIGTGVIAISLIEFYAIRIVYTKISGTGSLQATVVGKVS